MQFETKLYLALAMAGYSDAFFRMSCPGRVVRDRVDPIVNPGKVAGHVHTVSGGSGFSASMTYQDARASNATEKLHAFPEGFRMLAGDSNKRSGGSDLATQGISYACLGANQPETNNIPNYSCPGGLRAQVFFPACWDGKNLDSPDHKSHVAYPTQYNNGYCPDAFPVHMISIFYEILYNTNIFADQWNGTQHPFVFANGDATGYGLHGDFLNGWDVDVLQNAIDTCNDASGSVDKCAAVTQYSVQECQQCQIPTTVKEPTGGSLTQLPGCNPITHGPDPAVPGTCNDTTGFGAGETNFIDLTHKGWAYAGCGTDNISDRAFRGSSQGSDNMTVPTCIDFCSDSGYTYAGLEYGRECWCANQLDSRYAPKDGIMGSCNYACAGDEKQVCGGWAAMSVYRDCKGDAKCENWGLGTGGKADSKTMKARVKARSHARQLSD
ncbi:hypothetical protein FB567DRAFT_614146 [Paraphoma chrysanthemicola]|uniref:WSC domain-containing protein n=1 Tax=Paraphoma chrysanthemicola TaxID=798071 RepID=A0A8K0RBL3_9PLEO|nr:hypothetical protein FB567DRAFT_614146 [Paraphoma chrysanthemicola]